MTFAYVFFSCFFCTQLFGADKTTNVINHPITITLSITPINTTCQKANGKIIAQASGGVAPYDYTISGPFAPQPSGVFFNLPAGTYTVTATDALLATASQTVTLTNTFALPIPSIVSGARPSGCNTHDGVLVIAGSGGLAPYTYSLDNINYQSSNTFSNLTAGNYEYAVKDANGCTSVTPNTFINNSQRLQGNCVITSPSFSAGYSCDPFTVSTVQINGPTGGTLPYTYSRDGINYQTSNTLTNLPDGIITIWIKDATGLIFLFSLSFMDDCDVPFLISSITQQAQCGINGAITVTANSGASPYLYSIDGVTFQTSNQFTGLVPGLYTVTVKDFYNLIVRKLVNVANNCAKVIANTTNSTCGNNNGKIVAQASNGTAPYQFSLDGITYSANNTFTNLAAGNYIVYTKDATGGIGTANVVISNIAGPHFFSVNTMPSGCDNQSGTINAVITNGTAPFQYSIDGTLFQSNPLFTGVAPGNYTITVKDANRCIDTKPALVAASTNFPIVHLGNDTTLCNGQTLLLNATNTNATYLWQDGSTQSTFSVKQKGNYNVKVDIAGCIKKDSITVDYLLTPQFTLGEDKLLCQGNSLILKPTFSNAVQLQSLNYLWQDGSVNSTYIANQNGLYRLKLSNACGFTSDEINITKGICELYLPNAFTPDGNSKNDIFKVGYGDNIVEFQMQIFNRYGQLVFKTNDKNKGWDGKLNGKTQQAGTYAWLIRYKITTSSFWQDMQGTVILLR